MDNQQATLLKTLTLNADKTPQQPFSETSQKPANNPATTCDHESNSSLHASTSKPNVSHLLTITATPHQRNWLFEQRGAIKWR